MRLQFHQPCRSRAVTFQQTPRCDIAVSLPMRTPLHQPAHLHPTAPKRVVAQCAAPSMPAARSQPQEMTAAQPAALAFRRYRAETQDIDHVRDICAHVYGGTDYMPRIVEGLGQRPDTLVLVAEGGEGEGEAQRLDAVACGQRRGEELFLFGLRVREGLQGRGLGRALLAEVCSPNAHAHLGTITTLVGATIPQNLASLAIFKRLGFQYVRTVEVWPAYADLYAYEATLGWPQQQAAPQDRCIVDSIPGAREVLDEACAGPGCALSDWQPCTAPEQLAEAVASIRDQQQQQQQQRDSSDQACSEQLDSSAQHPHWLPWCYEVHPVGSAWLEQRIAAGEVWLLPAPAAPLAACAEGGAGGDTALPGKQQQQQYVAAMVMARSVEFRRHVAGILAVDGSYVGPAVALAASRQPHFISFCDRGSLEQGPSVLDKAAPRITHVTNHADSHHSTFLVLTKGLVA